VVQRYDYDSFGNLEQQGESIEQPFTYTARELDEETGLYYYRARYYDPQVGRFVSKDPIGFEGGDNNLYGYVLNNPVNATDPEGLCKWTGSVTMKVGTVSRRGVAAGVVLMALKSECCNNKQAEGVYTAYCGGVSISPKRMPVQVSTAIVVFEGPETPSGSDPKGIFSYLAGGVGVGSYGRLRTGSLVSAAGWSWEAGHGIGLNSLLGFTVGYGKTN